jgi:phage-related protein
LITGACIFPARKNTLSNYLTTVTKKCFQIWKRLLSLLKFFSLQYFQTRFLEEADKFIAGLNPKAAKKVIYNIDLAEQTNDPRLFKKLQNDIWEFRTNFGGQQIRLLAFWDKDSAIETLVFATHGFIKKVDKIPKNEIERAIHIKAKYFESKHKK